VCYIEFFDKGLGDGGFARGRGSRDADDLKCEPGRFIFWLLGAHSLNMVRI